MFKGKIQIPFIIRPILSEKAYDMTRNKQAASLPLPPEEILSDYRLLDGASADAFLSKVKETLEKWA